MWALFTPRPRPVIPPDVLLWIHACSAPTVTFWSEMPIHAWWLYNGETSSLVPPSSRWAVIHTSIYWRRRIISEQSTTLRIHWIQQWAAVGWLYVLLPFQTHCRVTVTTGEIGCVFIEMHPNALWNSHAGLSDSKAAWCTYTLLKLSYSDHCWYPRW